jgi:hypothetical protein
MEPAWAQWIRAGGNLGYRRLPTSERSAEPGAVWRAQCPRRAYSDQRPCGGPLDREMFWNTTSPGFTLTYGDAARLGSSTTDIKQNIVSSAGHLHTSGGVIHSEQW